ncbi:MAG: ABC transporter substrate-binding protein [Caldilineaceae bacterium]|nr:ABC transporter substrate-binding protein [Caldilineaceae bacterium]
MRPIVKIGLIAPFEGLYRQSGYAALAAMRQALAECTPPGLEVMPLALDDSGDPVQARRAAQKLLVDPTVVAVIGPLLLDAVPAVTAVMTQASDIPWLIPSLVAPAGGFAGPQTASWLESQVEYIANTTSATRILLLGLPGEWTLQIRAAVPVVRIDELDSAAATLEAGDVVLWAGRPDVGARWLSVLRLQQPDVEFWLAEQAGLEIFAAHATDLHAAHWLVWTDLQYNQWLQSADPATQPNDFTHYLTYRATCIALSNLASSPSPTATVWQLQHWPIEHPNVDEE